MGDTPGDRARRFGRTALALAAVNAAVAVAVLAWCRSVGSSVAGSGDPPGPQLAAALPLLAGLAAGGLVAVPVATAGVLVSVRGLLAARRDPGRAGRAECAVGLALHAGPPIALVAHRLTLIVAGKLGL